jgi:acyl-CoA synthetase (AMP-forming)/AMP-acid ligase II
VLTDLFPTNGGVALVRSDGTETSYAELASAVSRGAVDLAEQGAVPGRAVAVCVRDPVRFLVSAASVWRTGAALVPIDPRGPRGPEGPARRAHAFLLVKDATMDGTLTIARCQPNATIDPRAALVLFTSGSSAQPRAVVLSEAGVAANVSAILRYLPIAANPRTAIVVPLTYSYGLVGQALTTLAAGGTLLLLGDLTYPMLQLGAMKRLRAQGLSSVPSSLRVLARAAAELEPEARPHLGYVASAGGVLDELTRSEVAEWLRPSVIFNQYGLTEASPRVTQVSDREAPFAAGSVGRALDGVEVYAASETGARLPAGSEGELVVRGPNVMLGYLHDETATARVLSDGGALRTGDFGFVDSAGYVFVRGRRDGVVKCAGERVGVEEVAATLRGAPGVADACVVALPHESLGAELVALVEGDVASAQKSARAELMPAKRPSRIIAVEAIPRTANGKVDLRRARAIAEKQR